MNPMSDDTLIQACRSKSCRTGLKNGDPIAILFLVTCVVYVLCLIRTILNIRNLGIVLGSIDTFTNPNTIIVTTLFFLYLFSDLLNKKDSKTTSCSPSYLKKSGFHYTILFTGIGTALVNLMSTSIIDTKLKFAIIFCSLFVFSVGVLISSEKNTMQSAICTGSRTDDSLSSIIVNKLKPCLENDTNVGHKWVAYHYPLGNNSFIPSNYSKFEESETSERLKNALTQFYENDIFESAGIDYDNIRGEEVSSIYITNEASFHDEFFNVNGSDLESVTFVATSADTDAGTGAATQPETIVSLTSLAVDSNGDNIDSNQYIETYSKRIWRKWESADDVPEHYQLIQTGTSEGGTAETTLANLVQNVYNDVRTGEMHGRLYISESEIIDVVIDEPIAVQLSVGTDSQVLYVTERILFIPDTHRVCFTTRLWAVQVHFVKKKCKFGMLPHFTLQRKVIPSGAIWNKIATEPPDSVAIVSTDERFKDLHKILLDEINAPLHINATSPSGDDPVFIELNGLLSQPAFYTINQSSSSWTRVSSGDGPPQGKT